MAFLLSTTLKRYCIQIFAARYFRELAIGSRNKGHAKKRVLQYLSYELLIIVQFIWPIQYISACSTQSVRDFSSVDGTATKADTVEATGRSLACTAVC